MFYKNRLILGCILIPSINCFMLFWDTTITWLHTLSTPSYHPLHTISFLISTCCWLHVVTLQVTAHKQVNATWIQSKIKKKIKKRKRRNWKSFQRVYWHVFLWDHNPHTSNVHNCNLTLSFKTRLLSIMLRLICVWRTLNTEVEHLAHKPVTK